MVYCNLQHNFFYDYSLLTIISKQGLSAYSPITNISFYTHWLSSYNNDYYFCIIIITISLVLIGDRKNL